jgi:hypothetical protein
MAKKKKLKFSYEQCNDCVNDLPFQHWKELINFLEFLRLQGLITSELCNKMYDRLIELKPDIKVLKDMK